MIVLKLYNLEVICFCFDMRVLNIVIFCFVIEVLIVEDIKFKFEGVMVFSVLDMNEGYY